MDMLQRRLMAFHVFMELHDEQGFEIPAIDKSPENVKRWTDAYNKKVYEYEKLNKLVFPFIVVFTTSTCTLNCRYCGNYMPLLKSKKIKYNYAIENFKKDMSLLMQAIDGVHRLAFSGGGETLATPKFELYFEEIAKSGKVDKIIIRTNGTVTPSDKLLSVINAWLSKQPVGINVADYALSQGPLKLKREKTRVYGH